MSRKIILVSNTEWYLYNFRRSLAEFLRAEGMEVVLVSPSGPYAEKLQGLGFRWLPWEVGRKTLAPWEEAAALAQIACLYRRERPDLVHHHTIKPGLYGSLAARWVGVRGVVNSITGRGYVFLGDNARVRVLRWLVKGLYRFAFRAENCAAIFENASDRAYFVGEGLIAEGRTHLIESVGVDAERFSPQPPPTGTPIILLAARMLWDKGVGVLVEAARLLRPRLPVRVALVGSPDPGNPASIPEETLQAWEAEGVVEWWGFRPDMAAVYHESHIVALPSMYAEGVPTTLVEAAACGLPVVTTAIPGCQDFVVDGVNGFVVPPGDAEALAAALEKLASDAELRARMGAAGRARVLAHYTAPQVNAATQAVYRSVWERAR